VLGRRLTTAPNGRKRGSLGTWRSGEVIRRAKSVSRNQLYVYGVMGLIRPAGRTATGRWLYDDQIFRRLAEIARLRRRGRTLQQIRQELSGA
jgi:DNA-binding transcriptional MerR regulator